MGHGTQHVEGATPVRREARVGHRGCMQIEAEIFGQGGPVENVIQQAFVSWSEEHRVVSNVVGPVCAEVEDEEGHGPLGAFQLALGSLCRGLVSIQPGVGMVEVRVGHHGVEGIRLALAPMDYVARCAIGALKVHLLHGGIQVECAPEVFEEGYEGANQGAPCPPLGKYTPQFRSR